ncbi:hypothetical protein [Breznakia pachnodae]|uniref:Transposase n=1 Tax=Breznakia pachnodae TaxID=265178 RepID=A0ABU0E6T4_9FIRM|nr:hypothetical protein [Breznakia pachnodae]MDQ0362575.1 hypothetical protein [Breznakia pachnodae]
MMKQKQLLEPWIYNILIHRRERTCLLPKRIVDQYSERRIINDLKRQGVSVKIVKENHAGEDVNAIPIDNKKRSNAGRKKKSAAVTNYIIERI